MMATPQEIAAVRGWIRMGGIKVARTQGQVTGVYMNKTLVEPLGEMGVPCTMTTAPKDADATMCYFASPESFTRAFGEDILELAASIDQAPGILQR